MASVSNNGVININAKDTDSLILLMQPILIEMGKRYNNSELDWMLIFAKWYLADLSVAFDDLRREQFSLKSALITNVEDRHFSNNLNKPLAFRLREIAKAIIKTLQINVGLVGRDVFCWFRNIAKGNLVIAVNPNKFCRRAILSSGRPTIIVPPSLLFKNKLRIQQDIKCLDHFLSDFFYLISSQFSFDPPLCDLLIRRTKAFFSQTYRAVSLFEANRIVINNLGVEIWFGSLGSRPELVLGASLVRSQGVKVVSFDHGSGNSHHLQLPVHYVEYMHADVFVTFNALVARERARQLYSKYCFGKIAPDVKCIAEFIKDERSRPLPIKAVSPAVRHTGSNKTVSKPRNVLYVGTAYHGWRSRLRPIFYDELYQAWQTALVTACRALGLNIYIKPHPGGTTPFPRVTFEEMGAVVLDGNIEDADLTKFDFIILDFIFSSSTPFVFGSGLPIIFYNLGFPELTTRAKIILADDVHYCEYDLISSKKMFDHKTHLCELLRMYDFKDKVGREFCQSYFEKIL